MTKIRKFNEELNSEDQVIDMYISDFETDEDIDYRLVVKTKSGKKYYIKAKNYSPFDSEED